MLYKKPNWGRSGTNRYVAMNIRLRLFWHWFHYLFLKFHIAVGPWGIPCDQLIEKENKTKLTSSLQMYLCTVLMWSEQEQRQRYNPECLWWTFVRQILPLRRTLGIVHYIWIENWLEVKIYTASSTEAPGFAALLGIGRKSVRNLSKKNVWGKGLWMELSEKVQTVRIFLSMWMLTKGHTLQSRL